MMPEDERVPVQGWLPTHGKTVGVEAYLIEGEPLNGASGSPVFIRRSIESRDANKKLKTNVYGSVWMLGLLSNSWFAKPGRDYEISVSNVVPRGINVVVPSMKINEVLDQPKLRQKAGHGDLDASKARGAKPRVR
jgi:hypothetical protein